jgi:2'-5' RNA ligase
VPRLLIVAYPEISKSDLNWIQGNRRKYDELSYQAVAPHFTLFFPSDEFKSDDLLQIARRNIGSFPSFQFCLRSAMIMPPVVGEYSYVFLVPDEGFSQIIQLHDRIYSEELSSSQRLDIPFVPHVTVASSKNVATCKELVDVLNSENFEITGKIQSLDLVFEDGNRITTLSQIRLSRGA